MSTEVRWRRGTTAENDDFTGAEAEITVDTERKELRVHDGSTKGGVAQLTETRLGTDEDKVPTNADLLNSSSVSSSADADTVAKRDGSGRVKSASGGSGKDSVVWDDTGESSDKVTTGSDARAIASLGNGHVSGIVPTNDGDHNLSFTAGGAYSKDGMSHVRVSSLTKEFNASFSKGDNEGGLGDGVSLPTDGTLHIFAIKEDSSGDGDLYGDVSIDGSNVPSGWTVIHRVFSVTTDGSSNIHRITALELAGGAVEILRKTPPQDFNESDPGDSATLRALSVPADIQVIALHSLTVFNGSPGSRVSFILTSPDQDDVDPGSLTSSDAYDGLVADNSGEVSVSVHKHIRTNASGEIRVRINNSDSGIRTIGITQGWIDNRRS